MINVRQARLFLNKMLLSVVVDEEMTGSAGTDCFVAAMALAMQAEQAVNSSPLCAEDKATALAEMRRVAGELCAELRAARVKDPSEVN